MLNFATGGAGIASIGQPGPILINRASGVGAGAAADPPLITAQSLGAVRNNFDGSLGFRFTVGASPITVTALGRWVIAGNALTHVIRLFGNMAIPAQLGSVTVNTSGAPTGTYLYGTLGSPIVLSASTQYALLSDEINGSDQWNDTAAVTANAVVTINDSAYRTGLAGGAGAINSGALGSRSYIPVNFQYH